MELLNCPIIIGLAPGIAPNPAAGPSPAVEDPAAAAEAPSAAEDGSSFAGESLLPSLGVEAAAVLSFFSSSVMFVYDEDLNCAAKIEVRYLVLSFS